MAKSRQATTDKLLQQVDDLGNAIANIAARPITALSEEQEIISALLEEARVSLEELRVGDEELREQNEELIISRNEFEAQRHHYHNLFNLAPIGYLLTNRYGVIRESNQAAATLLNVRLDYLIGKPLAIFVLEQHRVPFRNWLTESDTIDTVRIRETPFQPRNDAEVRDILLTIGHVVDAEAQSDVRFRWLLYDITERKKAEWEEREQYFHETFERAAVGIAHADRTGQYLRVNQKTCEMFGYTREELLQLTTFDITVMDDLDYSHEILRQLIEGEIDSIAFDKRYRRKDGSIIWVHLTASGVYDTKGNYAYSISILNDITESKRLIAAELEQRKLAEAVRKTATILTSTLNLEEVLDHIVETIGLIVPYDGASILLTDVDPMDVYIERGWGDILEIIPQWEKVLSKLKVSSNGLKILNQLVNTQTPFIITDLKDHRPKKVIATIDAIHSLIIVPIIARDVIIGYIELHSLSPNFFTMQHSEHLQIFASQAAVAIQNAQAYKQGQLLAALEERQRLARDLHDAVTQTLFTSSVISEALLRTDPKNADKIFSHLNTLHLLNRGAMAEMRSLLIELQPDYLLKLPLSTQIQQLIDAVKSRKQMEIPFTIKGDKNDPIPAEVQIAFYRIMQEALNNIVKHASASKVEVVLDYQPEQIVLSISDNGVGFNIDEASDSLGMGTTNMRERANSIQAQFQISSLIGNGSQIILSWLRESHV